MDAGPLALKIYLSLCAVTGVLMCFYGYRLFKFVLGLVGLFAGGYAAAETGFALSNGSLAVAVFCGVIGGLLGAVLMVTIYFLSVFVIGAALGGLLAAIFTVHAAADIRSVAIAVLAAAGGVLALVFQRFLIVVATALNGSALAVASVLLLITATRPLEGFQRPPIPSGLHQYLLLVGWAVLGCVGAWVQFETIPPPESSEASSGPRRSKRPWVRRRAKSTD